VWAPLPADLHFWPAPRTYTGQELVELHTFSSPPLVDLLVTGLLDAGARAAQPGEFTLRAFLSGKLDLTQAEAVLGVIEAGDRDQLQQALAQMAGGLARPLQPLRDDLLNLLADVEAGLDFADEDLRFVNPEELLVRLRAGLSQLTKVRRQFEKRTVSNSVLRVVLVGRPNTGKSSLFNALTGGPVALVSPEPGTTRDYLIRRLDVGGISVDLIDTAGWQQADNAIEQQAQSLANEQTAVADLVVLCLETGQPITAAELAMLQSGGKPTVIAVGTKCDLAPAAAGFLNTSAMTGAGLAELRMLLAEQAHAQAQIPLAPSLSRGRHHIEACLQHLQKAQEMVLQEDPPELLALELREALDELGTLVGAIYTDDLLDRIFSRFCIGK
jgi:tRNA modification GTPase